MPSLSKIELTLIGIVIPGKLQELDQFTFEAITSAQENYWVPLTALLDYKILPVIRKRIDIGGFKAEEKSDILVDLRQEVIKSLSLQRFSTANAYSSFQTWVDGIFYGILFNRFEAKIVNYAYRRTSDPELSKDLAAQTFLNMLEAIELGQTWTISFSGWLYRIVHNLVIDHYRWRDRRQSISLGEVPHLSHNGDSLEQLTEHRLSLEKIHSFMKMLTKEQAQVIELRFFEGYSSLQIAEIMKKSEGAVKALQHRGLINLRQLATKLELVDSFDGLV